MKTNKKELIKLAKGVTQEFLDSIQAKSIDDLKATIVTLQVQNQDNEQFKASEGYVAAKEEFEYAKEAWGLVDGPVKDTTVSVKNRTKAVVERLKERGGA